MRLTHASHYFEQMPIPSAQVLPADPNNSRHRRLGWFFARLPESLDNSN
jgi:hypothetical protein